MVQESWSWDHGKVPIQDFFVPFIKHAVLSGKTTHTKWCLKNIAVFSKQCGKQLVLSISHMHTYIVSFGVSRCQKSRGSFCISPSLPFSAGLALFGIFDFQKYLSEFPHFTYRLKGSVCCSHFCKNVFFDCHNCTDVPTKIGGGGGKGVELQQKIYKKCFVEAKL